MSSFFEFIRTSFWHVAPILIAGAIAVAIAAERARALFTVYPIRDTQGFFDKITDLVLAGKFSDAVALCDRLSAKPVARVTKEALLRAHQPESLIENGLQIAVGDATQSIQKRTVFLSTIANVATLLGLLGTIAGLISSFEAVGHADPQQKSVLLAAGISTAMNATMMGLGVAIPCMIAFSFLMNRTNRLLSEIDQGAMRTLDILKQRYYQAESGWAQSEQKSEVTRVSNGHDSHESNVQPIRRSA
jgi:biopolymer transport protein ExbB/TolQ